MKNKTVVILLAVLAVLMYTTAVINFCTGNVLSGIGDTLMACSDALMAYAVYRVGKLSRGLHDVLNLGIKFMEKLKDGVPATLTITKADDDENEEIPEDELTEDEKRIKRMAEEYDELAGRLDRLRDFIASNKFETLPENSRTLLEEQHKAMTDYEKALGQRIRIECKGVSKTAE